jgi:hypothetical protein
VRREQVVEVLRAALEPLAFVNAAWLGGSDAFGQVAATFGAVEAALADMQICP